MTGTRKPTVSFETRKVKSKAPKKSESSSSSRSDHSSSGTEEGMNIGFTYPVLSAIAISIVSWFAYQGYLETRVISPLSEEKVLL